MADTYQVAIKGLLNLANQSIELSLPDMLGTPDYSCYDLLLVTGDNLIQLPTAAKHLLIIFDPTNSSTVTLKGSPTDAGIELELSQMLLPVPVSSQLYLNSDADDTKPTKIITF